MLARWWNRFVLLAILGLTALSIIIVWPSEPDRYLPDAIPWPEGKGIKLKLPTIEGGTFGLSTIERRAMSLGLDLRGGTRLVLEPAEGTETEDLESALEGARRVIERRVNAFGVAESEVNLLGDNQLSVQLPGIEPEEAKRKIGKTALLQFCEPIINDAGQVLVAHEGRVRYQTQSCEPVRDGQGNVVIDPVDGEGAPPQGTATPEGAATAAPSEDSATATPQDEPTPTATASEGDHGGGAAGNEGGASGTTHDEGGDNAESGAAGQAQGGEEQEQQRPRAEFEPWPPSGGEYTTEQIVWQPATADLNDDGTPDATFDGQYLESNTFVDNTPSTANPLGEPILIFSLRGDGPDVAEQVTSRLARRQYPLAPFLDGEPIRGEDGRIIAPNVQSTITNQGTITGLTLNDARELSTLLNTGAFPIALEVVLEQNVDSTLGETTVKNSVIAGEVALLLIMLFMIAYYRLPGLMAALALIVYTSFTLAIFKLWPVTLTLAGVAAFILSVGMAVDANILIFERMKEELRVGRNLITALDDGFNRAWSSIRDSNISTLITCGILYWFGNQFDESAIKGFALTLAIGVLVSMFSAITVTRTFMRTVVGNRAIARRLFLFGADLPEHARPEQRRAPAIAGGANGGRSDEEEGR